MANGFQGPPAVDFYSQLSGLGDVIAKNRADQAKRDAFAQATMPGPDGQIDYGKAILGLAQVDPQAAALLAAQRTHADTLKQQAYTNAHQLSREKIEDDWSDTTRNDTLAHQRAVEARLANPIADGYRRNPDGSQGYITGGPADPTTIAQVGAAKAAAEASANIGKPTPFETLSGTKFLVRQSDGSYTTVDPRAITAGAPAGSPPAPDPASMPAPGPGPGPAPAQTGTPAPAPGAVTGQPQAAPDLSAVDPATGRREAWLKSQPSDVQAYIKKIADYEVDPRTTSIKGGHREQIMSAVANYDPTYDQNTFGSRSKAIKDFSTGPQGNIVRSFDVAIDHLDTLQRAADALKNGNYRILNELRNKWREQSGSELPTDFKALVPIVSGEIAKAVVGSQNALADREELRAGLKQSASPEQLSGVITGYKALMAGQLKGLRKQYEETTGKKNFDSRVRETTRRAILSDEGGKADVTINGYTIKEN